MSLSVALVGEHAVEVLGSDEAVVVTVRLVEDVLHLLVAQLLLELQGHLSKLLHINFTLNSKSPTLCVLSKELKILSMCLRECEL